MSALRLRAARTLSQQLRASHRSISSTSRQLDTGAVTTSRPESVPETTDATGQPTEVMQAPNRAGIWARSQQPRSKAMVGPRFEQTDFSLQPQPYSAMELVHKQPVRWTHDRIAVCDGGGGPAGHPRIFINTDKAEISVCNYCGLPFANEHHRKHLESLPETSYPLS